MKIIDEFTDLEVSTQQKYRLRKRKILIESGRYIAPGKGRLGKAAWNKGLTKKDDLRIASYSIKLSAALKGKPNGRKGIHFENSGTFKKGHKHTNETKEKLRKAMTGKSSNAFKGEMAGYTALHSWVKSKNGKAWYCSNNINHNSKPFVWANISGEYKRDLSDWKQLCTKCNLNDGVKIHKRFYINGKYTSGRII